MLFEIANDLGKLVVEEDQETGHVYAVIPLQRKVPPAVLREIRELTMDPWRYVDGVGLVLDVTAWRREAEVTDEEVRSRFERYKEILGEVIKIATSPPSDQSEGTKRRKKKKKKAKKKRKKSKRRGE